MQEKERTTLRIAIIADDYNSANECYQRFINDNRDIVLIPGKNKTILNDGTIIERYSVDQLKNPLLKTVGLDQVLLCMEDKVNIEVIKRTMDLLHASQVPKSYWFMCYEEDE